MVSGRAAVDGGYHAIALRQQEDQEGLQFFEGLGVLSLKDPFF